VRKVMLLLTVPVLAMGLAACGSSGSSSSGSSSTSATSGGGGATATLTGKVTSKGTKDVSGTTNAKLEVEADDYYFEPTYVKAKPGQTITVELHNEGKANHTFTVSALGINVQLAPDAKKDVTVTVPKQAGLVEFHCNFHSGMGMRGAFVVGTGGTGAAGSGSGSSTTSTTTKSSGSGY
jgi:plastocyanin